MGYTFSNIQLRRPASFSEADAPALAEALLTGSGLRKATQEDADITVQIFCPPGSEWISVYSEVLEADPDAQLQKAKTLSALLGTDALAISCFDSDYLFLNLLNPEEKTDLWANAGSAAAAGISGGRRANYGAWRKRISDVDRFRACMRAKRVFAEDCLYALEPLLNLPASQSIGGVLEERPEDGLFSFFYAAPDTMNAADPPVLVLEELTRKPCESWGEKIISAVNVGGASRGLGIAFSGPYVDRGDISIYSAELRYFDAKGLWHKTPLELKKIPTEDRLLSVGDLCTEEDKPVFRKYDALVSQRPVEAGTHILYAELPDLPIARRVNQNLPLRKYFEKMQNARITLRFIPSGFQVRFVEITVHLIPLRNPAGQCGWNVRMFGRQQP